MAFVEHSKWIIFLFLAMAAISFQVSNGDPRTGIAAIICGTEMAENGAILAKTFVPGMENLSTMINQDGFGTAVVGSGPNAFYGLAQCMKDLNSIDCRLCYSEMRSLLPTCYPKTGGRIFLDGCFARYENYSFFDQAMDKSDTKVCYTGRNSTRPEAFQNLVREVVGNVSSEAQKRNGSSVNSISDSNLVVYALAQCWESINTSLCKSCLEDAAMAVVSCTPGTEGRALNAGCYLRYSTSLFWNVYATDVQSSGKSKTFWIILAAVLAGILLISGILIWKTTNVCSRSKSRTLRGLSSFSDSRLTFKYRELKHATGNFDNANKLGQGGYGTVYKGVLSDGREVAVKRLFLNTRQWINQFFNEVDLTNRVRHKNLVKLLGCSIDGPESLLVYEFYVNKSLDNFIFDSNQAKLLDWHKRFDIILGVAEGLSYLHEESEIRIIHRDIKASNILLDDKLKAKITDFGLARSFAEDQTHLSTGIAGTLGYLAPEYIVHGQLTEKADVYSFGVLILEIITGERCNVGIGAQPGKFFLAKIWNHYKANKVEGIIDDNIYNECFRDEILHVVQVSLLCTQATPSLRPPMPRIVELLRSTDAHELVPTDPPYLDVLNEHLRGETEVSDRLSVPCAMNFSVSSASSSGIKGR
ncbi:cysteine-rich receptor-like protein kinase 2 [Amborella trichopoda]|nr:cysteine-rich receptor-like protein kinase 2 [Amborella trichopoda]|eukprot:XP_006841023.2 cysteine-rich receptor-like protein kinase 2 [Amborella trichopoda]